MVNVVSAQGKVTGRVVDAETLGDGLISVVIMANHQDTFVSGVLTDIDGYFRLDSLPLSGTVDLTFDVTGCERYSLVKVPVGTDGLLIEFRCVGVKLPAVGGSCVGDVNVNSLGSGQTFTSDQIRPTGYAPGLRSRDRKKKMRRDRRRKRKSLKKSTLQDT